MTRQPRHCRRCGPVLWERHKPEGANRSVRRCVKCGLPTTLKPRKAPRKQRKGSHAAKVREADRLFSLIIRDRDKTCQQPAWSKTPDGLILAHRCRGALQCAHMISRRYRATRWTLSNAAGLCAAAHVYYTHRPLEWDAWCQKRLGVGRWMDLKEEAMTGAHKLDIDKTLTMLRVEAERRGLL